MLRTISKAHGVAKTEERVAQAHDIVQRHKQSARDKRYFRAGFRGETRPLAIGACARCDL
jgi:hypothetical protein